MLYVYATCQVKADKISEFECIVQQMIEGTRQESHFIQYDCGKIEGKPNTYAFVETWKNLSDQQVHFALPHIQSNIPALLATLENDLDIQFITSI